MEPVLTCRFRLDETTVRRSHEEKYRTTKLLNLAFAVFCLGAAVLLLLRCLRSGSPGFYEFVPPAIFAAAAGILTGQAFRAVPRSVEQFLKVLDQRIGSRESDLIIRFYPDRFVTENSVKPGATDHSYGDLFEVLRGKTTIGLLQKDRAMFSVDPARFENGTEADFWKLMNEKCPNAVPKKYRQA